MAPEYYVRVRDPAGVKQWDIGNFLSLTYTKVVNDVGGIRFDLPRNHVAIASFQQDAQLEVWRCDKAANIDWYCDFFGLYRVRDKGQPLNSKGLFTARGLGQLDFLDRSIVAFPAGSNNRNVFTAVPAETAMKLLVQYNATSDATAANDRIRNAGAWAANITIEADGATGNDITESCAHKGLLPTLQRFGSVGGLDFDLVKIGPEAWEFRTMPLLGDDLSANVTFSIDWGNMGEPRLIGGDAKEYTVGIVAGSNQRAARDFEVVLGPNYAAGINDREIFVNASGKTSAELNATGVAKMNELRTREDLTFTILQTAAYRYGRDYCIAGKYGDLVNSNFEEGSVIKKINSVTVVVETSSGGQQADQIRAQMVTAL